MLSRQQRMEIASRSTTRAVSVPSPVTGWNTRDALDGMDATDAVVLDNWYPDAGGVVLRNGYQAWATGLGGPTDPGPILTLAEYDANNVRKFLAAGSGKIFDISASGPHTGHLQSGFSLDIWQTVSFLSRLFFFNGRDTPQVFDGAALSDAGFTGISDQRTLYGVCVYQQRLFMWEQNSTGFWYALLNSISGTVAFYDLAGFAPRGGNLLAATVISHDGGNGVQDFIVFIMSSGDCFLFFGNDPSLIDSWQLVGVYRLSPPVGPRAVCNYGGDAFVTTYDDHVPLQQQLVALKLGEMPPRSKISNSVQDAVIANKTGTGWQALYYPAGRRIIYNIPNPDGTFDQHVQNTSSGAFCRFRGMPANCWGLFRDKLYFGSGNGVVYQADVESLDAGQPIYADGQQAWNTFGSAARKRVTAVRPIVQGVGGIEFAFGIGFDFNEALVPVAGVTTTSGAAWDVSLWDVTPWSPEIQVDSRWRIGGGTGEALSCRLRVSGVQQISWLRTDYRLEAAQFL